MNGPEADTKVFKSHLFRKGTLRTVKGNAYFVLENSTGENIEVTGVNSLSFGGRFIAKDNFVFLTLEKQVWKPAAISSKNPLNLNQNVPLQVIVKDFQLSPGIINVRLSLQATLLGEVIVDVNETVAG